MLANWITNIYSTIFPSGWISGLFWNIVVTIFGIFFTVYFVDRRAKKREEKRWQPAKDNLHYKLFYEILAVTGFLLQSSDEPAERKHYRYFFGSYYVATSIDVKSIKLKELLQKGIFLTGIKLQGLDEYTVSKLEKTSNNIQSLLNEYPHLFEPELLNFVLRFQDRITPLFDELNRYLAIDTDEREGKINLNPLAEEAIPLLLWLSLHTTMIL